MTLSVMERLLLLSLLPPTGDIATLRIVRQLREALSFTEEEHAAFGMEVDGTRVQWDETKAVDKDVDIGKRAHAVIVDALKGLSDSRKLSMEQVDLYERFVPDED